MHSVLNRKLALIIVAFLVLASLSVSLPESRAATPLSFTLSGRVFDASSNLGVPAHLSCISGPDNCGFDTAADGTYSISLTSGTFPYNIQIKAGYCLGTAYRTVPSDQGNQTLNVGLNRRLDYPSGQGGYACDDLGAFNSYWIAGTSSLGHISSGQQINVNLPFSINYFGSSANSVAVTPNGYLTVGHQDPLSNTNVQIPNVQQPNNAIYLYWDTYDLSNTSRATIWTATAGTTPNRKFAVEFRDMPLAIDPGTLLDFEAVFYEGGTPAGTPLDMVYNAAGSSDFGRGKFGVTGIEDSSGLNAFRYLYHDPRLSDHLVIHYYKPAVGTLSGQVTDFYSHQPLRAQVCPAYPDICVGSDPTTGNYTVRLIAAPYTLQTTAALHVTATQSVTIVAGQTQTVNIALNSAHVVYDPTPVTVSIPPNSTITRSLSLNNIGTGTLNYRLREATGPAPVGCNFIAAPEGTYLIDEQRSVPSSDQHGRPAAGNDVAGVYHYVVPAQNPPIPQPSPILLYTDSPTSPPNVITNTYAARALAALGWSYTGYYNNPSGWDAALQGMSGGLVVVEHDRNSLFGQYYNDLNTYMTARNGRVVYQSYDFEGITGPPTSLFETLGVSQTISQDLISPVTVYAWQPTEFIFNCPISIPMNAVPPWGQMNAPNPPPNDYGDYVVANSHGIEWAGFVIDPTAVNAAIVGRDDGRAVSAPFLISTLNGADLTHGSTPYGVELYENMIKYVGNPPIPWGDIPWLTESPTDGTVAPTTNFSDTLTFNSTGLSPGVYTGYLFGLTNDPNNLRGQIQVVLTVCNGNCPGKDLAVTGLSLHGYQYPRPVVSATNQVAVTVSNVGSQAITPQNGYLYVELYDQATRPSYTQGSSYYAVINQTLQPGQSVTVQITWSTTQVGNHSFYAWVNRQCLAQAGEGTVECDLGNNMSNNIEGPVDGCVFATNDYSFQDVLPPTPPPGPAANPFFGYIEALACRGVINGYTCGGNGEPCVPPTNRNYFRWGNTSTRGQFAKILANAMDWYDTIPQTQQHFGDVAPPIPGPANTFWVYIERAYQHGALSGYTGDGHTVNPCTGQVEQVGQLYYRPCVNITRGQITKFVVNGKGWGIYTPSVATFTDVPVGSTFFGYVERAVQKGIISGYSSAPPCSIAPCFLPGNTATRGQLSKITYLAITQP